MRQTPKLSVIVCCHNSRDRLRPTLAHLARQSADPRLWEVVVVDNASTDETSTVAAAEWAKFGSSVPFSVVAEVQPGLTHARRKGIESAHHDVIAFVDDDNWLDPDWVATVQEVMGSHPSIGILGTPNIAAICESEPPVWAPLMLGTLACGSAHFSGLAILRPGGIVAGAGMVIRREAWQQVGSRYGTLQMRDRAGRETSSGGDIELCYVVSLLGWDLAQHSGLRMQHWLPTSRFALEYLRSLARSNSVVGNSLDPLRRLASRQYTPAQRNLVARMYLSQLAANLYHWAIISLRCAVEFIRDSGVAHRIFWAGRSDQLAHLVMRPMVYLRSARRSREFVSRNPA
jgi:glycosyltransferase involved in cell wall biosynthesis